MHLLQKIAKWCLYILTDPFLIEEFTYYQCTVEDSKIYVRSDYEIN